MSKTDNGGPAFPFIAWRSPDGMVGMEQSGGMSLRDWFAGRIAAAAMTSATGLGEATKEERRSAFLQVAGISYEMADAMLEAREAQP